MKRITIILISLAFCLITKAQIPQSPTSMVSPNAANLGLFGEVPVSLFTGIPEISIPLYNLPGKDMDFSISLNYHAGGVRPDQHPGWVGTNWSLFAGGCISRVVKDLPDEDDFVNGIYSSDMTESGYFFNHSILNTDSWNQTSYIQTVAVGINQTTIGSDRDTEPDEFSFNFGGYNGKFYYSSDGKWVVECDKPVQVTFDGTFLSIPSDFLRAKAAGDGNLKPFSGFTITTENGVKYVFGGSHAAIEYCMGFFSQANDMWVATSWNLTQIIYPNGRNITFNYERGNFINQMDISMYNEADQNVTVINKSRTFFQQLADIVTGALFLNPTCGSASNAGMTDNKNGSLLSPVYLKSIISSDFSVQLTSTQSTELRYDLGVYQNINGNYDGESLPYLYANANDQRVPTASDFDALQWRKLDKISIYNINNQMIKSINLSYNNNATERLFLLGLTENDNRNVGNRSYNFSYDRKELLPPYLAFKTDHWGFYNNRYVDMNYISDYYTLREPDSTALHYGVINKITYPTGGSTNFVFEANQYSKQLKLKRWEGDSIVGGNKIAGGLRIKRIINNPNPDNSNPYSPNGLKSIVKEYYYINNYSSSNTNGTSSGELGGKIRYTFPSYTVQAYNNSTLTYTRTFFSSQSVLPLCSNSLGSHIGYSEVVEKLADGSFTRYSFSNFDNGYLDEKFDNSLQLNYTEYQPYNSKEQERGKLLKKELYDISGNIRYKEENTYIKSDTINNPFYVKSLSARYKSLCGTGNVYLEGTAIKIYTYSKLLSQKKSYFYNDQHQITQTNIEQYSYNKFNQLNKITTRTSDGKVKLKKFYYPADIINGVIPTIQVRDYTSFSNTMLSGNNHYLHPLIAEEDFLFNKFIKGVYNDYALSANNYPLLNNVYLSNDNQTYRRVYYCDNFDSKGNPLSITDNELFKTVYLWSYDGQYPVAEIKNASYAQVTPALSGITPGDLSNLTNPDMTIVNALRTSLPDAQVTTYTYQPLVGMTSMTDPRGVTTNLTYDTFNRLYLTRNDDKNIVTRYRYGYQNNPDNGLGGFAALGTPTLTANATVVLNVNDNASVSITGGSGSFTYSWYLKNSAGTVTLLSSLNSTSSQYTFASPQKGTVTLQCIITDTQLGLSTTISKSINCVPIAATISTNAETYIYPTNGTATISPIGGSGTYYETWYLKNSSGTILSSIPRNFTAPSWSFPCTQTGTLTLQCIVKDKVSADSLIVTKTITCAYAPLVVGTITSNASSYTLNSNGTATVSVSGGSGTYNYYWLLLKSGSILQSSSTATFSFNCSQTGTLTLQVTVSDPNTGSNSTVTKSITVN